MLLWAAAGTIVLGAIALAAMLARTGPGISLLRAANGALSLQSTQVTWFITRSAGWMAYLLLWLSTAWGLAVSSKIFDELLQRNFTYDFHEFLSLLALGFTAVHIIVLAFDQYLPFSAAQILLPFISAYRPFWVGIGVLALYLSLIVTITFYLRKQIGVKSFRLIHYLSLAAYFGAALHGLFAGTDSPLPAAQILYAGTFLFIIFLAVYWLVARLQQKNAQQYL
jgi:predicted ferric reductase